MKNAVIVFLILNAAFCFSQQPQWEWAKQSRGFGSNEGAPVITDSRENIYISGGFTSDTIHFGPYSLANVFPGTSTYDFFLTKYDSAGNVLWTTGAGGTGNEMAGNLVLDSSANIYVTGWFTSSTLNIGSYTLTNYSANTSDFFIAKYDSTGNLIWVRHGGGTVYDYATDISYDGRGYIYITGKYNSPSLTLNSLSITNSGMWDSYVAKYDTAGNVIWIRGATGSGTDFGTSIACDTSGNEYITGQYESPTLTFGPLSLSNSGLADVFVAKYDSAGTILWARSATGSAVDESATLVSDYLGNIYITGLFNSGAITFGTHTIFNSSPGYTVFVVKYDATGNTIWARGASGQGYGYCLTLDACENIYVTGSIYNYDTLRFDSVTLYTPVAGDAMFIVKLDSSGNARWGTALTCGGDDANWITVSKSGSVYVGGDFMMSPAIFGNDTLAQASGETIFLAKLIYSCSAIVPDIIQSGNQLFVSQAYASYQWFYNNVPIIGATDYFYVAAQNGDYSIVVTDCNGCSASATILNFVASSAELTNINNLISITPNPATSTVSISSPLPIKLITICNAIGENVWSDKPNSTSKIVDTFFGKGIYFVHVNDGENDVVKKIILD